MVDNVIDYINPSMYDYDADKQKCCDIYVICAIASSLISNQSRLTFPKIQILFFSFGFTPCKSKCTDCASIIDCTSLY